MPSFFGLVLSSLRTGISTTSVSAGRSGITSSVTASASNNNGGTLSYLWKTTGNTVTINTPSSSSTTVTGGGVAGLTDLYCDITNSVTGVTTSTPICVITWNPATSITSVTWSISSATTSRYNGTARSVTVVLVSPVGATYNLATTTATNAGSIASTILTGTGEYDGTFTSPNLTIEPETITLSSSGPTSFAFTGIQINIAYQISGVYAADPNYTVTGTGATNCGNYTVTLTESSSNYTLAMPNTFSWAITPTRPQNFTASVTDFFLCNFSWTAVGGCTYQLWGKTPGGTFSIFVNNITTTTTAYAAATNFDYEFYVVAFAPSGTSIASRTAYVYTGRGSYQDTIAYDGGYANQQPLCLTGSASGTIGLKNWAQGTYGITISTVFVRNASLNFTSSLLWGTGTRTIRWNLNGTSANFPLNTSTSAPNPYAGPTSRAVTTTGTVTYTMVASGTGWSTNNSGGVSGSFWARAQWRWTGTQVVTVPAVQPTVSYGT
jgi:hypothetical protein